MPHAAPDARVTALARVLAAPNEFAAAYIERFGALLNADNASELIPEYASSPASRAALGTAVRPAAARIVEHTFHRLLQAGVPVHKKRIIVFTSGGNGSGKSTSVHADQAQSITVDTTLSQWEPSLANIRRALAAGFDVQVNHISRCPEASWQAVLTRASDAVNGVGRVVTLAGHVQTHAGARHTVASLAQTFQDDARVRITVFENAPTGLVTRSLGWLFAQRYRCDHELTTSLTHALDEAFTRGRITAGIYRAAAGIASQ